MSLVNIPQQNVDPFARYKRNQLTATIQKGFTIIPNFGTLCLQIYRTPEFVSGRLKKELGTAITVDKDGTCKIRGVFSWQTIDDLVEKVIVDNVLCKKCANPETICKKTKIICKACGHVKESRDK